ncbi:hypothetical protein [Lactovum odontotermitis]
MKKLISLKPIEPYFFGGDYDFRRKNYRLISKDMPNQTELFGILRYLGISKKHSNYRVEQVDKDRIGLKSFELTWDGDLQNFGKINDISPLYLLNDKEEFLLPASYDFLQDLEFEEKTSNYGTLQLPTNFKGKDGEANGFINLKDGSFVSSDCIFSSYSHTRNASRTTKIGGQAKRGEGTMFIEVKKVMKKDYRFAFVADLKDDFFDAGFTADKVDKLVYVGKARSKFLVKMTDIDKENNPEKLQYPKKNEISSEYKKYVAISDCYVTDFKALNEILAFAMINQRSHSGLRTHQDQDKFEKQGNRETIIKAGSCFWLKDENRKEFENIMNNQQANIVGMNRYK